MGRYYDSREKKELIEADECRWLYDGFWCCCDKRFEENEIMAQDIGEGTCGRQCAYFTPEDDSGGCEGRWEED